MRSRSWGGVFEPVKPPVERPETPTTPPSTEDLLTIKIEDEIMAVVGANSWHSIAYGNGKYVAVGLGGYVTTSNDGVNWTMPIKKGSAHWFNVVYGGDRFVAIGNNAVLTIEDIDDVYLWHVYTNTVQGINADNHPLAYGNNVFITGKDIGYIQFANNGTGWSKFQLRSIRGLPLQIIYAGDKFRLVSSDGYYAEAINGTNWNDWNEYKLNGATISKTNMPYKMAYANNTVILAGILSDRIYHIDIDNKVVTEIQIDGVTSMYNRCVGVFFVNDCFFAIFSTYKFNGNDEYTITYSTSSDGLNWTSLKPIQNESMNTVNVISYGAMVIR